MGGSIARPMMIAGLACALVGGDSAGVRGAPYGAGASRGEAGPSGDPGGGETPTTTRRWLRSTGLSAAQLGLLRAQLATDDPETRRRAIETLAGLTPDSLPAIAKRMKQRRAMVLDPEAARRAMAGFRHGVGSRRADDNVDIEPGVAKVLSAHPSREATVLGESVLLLRSLERMATIDAGRVMAEFVDLDGGLWRREMARVQGRAGLWLVPALIELRSHPRKPVKRWAVRGLAALEMNDPKRSTGIADHYLAAQVVRAYASPLDFEAMPIVVRLVTAERLQVREAARWATAQFGKNAVWQLRELYEELTGQRAERAWDWQKTADELYTVIDRENIEQASTAFARGMQHFVAGDFETMHTAFDRALGWYPALPERSKMAAGYAALGDQRYEHSDLAGAEHAYQRAARLAEGEADRKRNLARLWLARSEEALAAGIVDLRGYDRALALDPELAPARAARGSLDGTIEKRQRTRRRWAAGGALVLMLTLLVLLSRPGRPTEQPVSEPQAG